MLGGYAGGQAEYLHVPFADVAPIKVPEGLTDEQLVMLSDVFPTGYMTAEHAEIEPRDTVAIWGLGPVGQFAIRSAWMMGAGQVIAIDRIAERLAMIANGDIDPSFVVTHRVSLDQGPEMYKKFRDKEDGCIKVVLQPGLSA